VANNLIYVYEKGETMFSEITVYEVRNNKQKEFESLMQEIQTYYQTQPGVVEVKLIKQKSAQTDFNRVIKEADPEKKSHIVGKVTYVLCLEVESQEIQTILSKHILEAYGKEFMKCLSAPPKIIMGERV